MSTRPVFEKLTIHSLRGRIAGQLREAILKGTLREGERVVERNLANALGASLTVIREALIELEMEGFITKKPNSSTYVTKLDVKESKKLFAVRLSLESYAVEQAAVLSTPQQLKQLEQLYKQTLGAARMRDIREYLKADYALHEMIWRMTDNEFLQAALRRVVLPLFAFTAIRLATRDTFDLVRDARSHSATIDAIKAHDGPAAKSALVDALSWWTKLTEEYVVNAEQVTSEHPLRIVKPVEVR